MTTNRLDAVIARRDFSLYTRYKRLGNFLMSLWASLWAGKRLYDVESGYRAFRIEALLSALSYYKGYKYSETVEVAVILARLGFRVDNDYLVPVPLFRSRTRLKDVAIDLAAIPAAAWRLEARRGAPTGLANALVYYLPLIVPLALLVMAANVLAHGLFLANDSMEHYRHIWYLSEQLSITAACHCTYVDSGKAMIFPYGIVPYLVAAALYQVLGDWAVTLFMVAGVLAMVWAAGLARPACVTHGSLLSSSPTRSSSIRCTRSSLPASGARPSSSCSFGPSNTASCAGSLVLLARASSHPLVGSFDGRLRRLPVR